MLCALCDKRICLVVGEKSPLHSMKGYIFVVVGVFVCFVCLLFVFLGDLVSFLFFLFFFFF